MLLSRYRLLTLCILLFLTAPAVSQTVNPPFINYASMRWADSVYQTLSYEERIGQLFMIATTSDQSCDSALIEKLVCDYHIGGIMFLKGYPTRQASLTNYFQQLSKTKMLIAIDGEWGLNMRLDSIIRFPRQMTLAAMPDEKAIYDMGKEIAFQCRRMGIHINFAPVLDINNNPANPVINSRSFGDNSEDVARKGLLYMKGMQDHGVLACGKHFPGHGNTDADSHYALPVISQTKQEMDSMELVPFKKLFNEGLGSVMVAHLFIPSYDTTRDRATTLSPSIVDTLLKQQLGFRGLVFTDALNMKGVSSYFNPGTVELKALQAGNDMLLYSADIPYAAGQIHYAIQNCELDEEELSLRVKKILMAKHWCGLNDWKPVSTASLVADLNHSGSEKLATGLFTNAVTVLADESKLIPVVETENKKIASIVINDSAQNSFQVFLSNHAPVSCFRMDKEPAQRVYDSLASALARYDLVILSIHNTSTRANNNFNITPAMNRIIKSLSSKTKVMVCVFGNAYCLRFLPDAQRGVTLIQGYEDTYYVHRAVAQLIFGAGRAEGRLPVDVLPGFKSGAGMNYTNPGLRLQYENPITAGYDPARLNSIDSIVNDAILQKAMPGCQVLVAAQGKIILEKSFGSMDYTTAEPVKNTTIYDLASLTKILATALATMKLYEEKKIDLHRKISRYLPEFRNTHKEDITLLDMLSHQAGLQAWIPFYKNTLENGKPSYNYFHKRKDENYSVPVADSMYMLRLHLDNIWKEIIQSPVSERGNYVYSDLGPLIMQKIIERITGRTLEEYTKENFYKPMGLHRLLFHPLEQFGNESIAPTENDTVFRMQHLRGWVHDPAAAMLGGSAGNAGLFGNAFSVAVIMQMLMNGGEYGGKRYFQKETIDYFTKKAFPHSTNRRGILFDKPAAGTDVSNPACSSASPLTFGHQGFTGTCAWADPQTKLVYVFLSNRVNPDASNQKLVKLNIRTRVMQRIYDAKTNFEE